MNNDKKFQVEIRTLKNISSILDDLYMEDIEQLEEMIALNTFKIAVIGGFSVGKTTFLNALIGRRLLYSSAKEATGTITYIKNSNEKCAVIELENNKRKKVNLESDTAYDSLKQYLNKNSNERAESVEIRYPLDGINKDVTLVDTPGFEGVSKKEMEITKKLMKEANATILMIKHNGLVKNDLDVLTGKLKEFGRIQTKDIFIVINKIGELYDIKSQNEIEESINRIINDVKSHLKENNLENIKVYALDSKDYLWGVDTDLYKSVKSKEGVKKILPQEEYGRRSKRFTNFKNGLSLFLEDSNRERAFEENIRERIVSFIEIFDEELKDRQRTSSESINSQITGLENQKYLIIENRRKILNKMKRQVSSSKDNFLEALKNDNNEQKKKENKEIAVYIHNELTTIEQLKLHGERRILNFLKAKINNKKEESLAQADIFLKSVSHIIGNLFSMEFNKILKSNINYSFNLQAQKTGIDFTFKYVEKEDDILKSIENEKMHKSAKIQKLKEKIMQMERENNESKINRYKEQLKDIDDNIKREINRIGTRPEPKQKYRTVTKTRRKFLFFKEEYDVEVPDGLDYTQCNNWDREKQNILTQGESSKSKIYSKIDYINSQINLISISKSELQSELRELSDIESNLKEAEKRHKHMKEKDKQLFLERKQNELSVYAEQVLKNNNKELYKCISEMMFENEKIINTQIESQAEDYIKIVEKQLDEKIERLKKLIDNTNVESGQAIRSFEVLKDEYKLL